MKAKVSRADDAFHRRFKSAVEWLKKNMAAKGYDEEYINGVVVKMYEKWDHIYTKWLDKQHRTPAMTAEKNSVRKEADIVYSEMVRMIKGNVKTTDAERIGLEIAPNKRVAHQSKPVVQTHPQVDVDTSAHSQLTVWWREKGAKYPGKPDGVNHIKVVWAKLLAPPTSRIQLVNEFIDTDNPHILKYGEEETGGIVYYAACWVSNTGEEGPWSPIAFAVIP